MDDLRSAATAEGYLRSRFQERIGLQDLLTPMMRHVMTHFRLADTALKAVGAGSEGTRCAVTVLNGDHPDEVLVLQGKQAEPSVLAPYVNLSAPEH